MSGFLTVVAAVLLSVPAGAADFDKAALVDHVRESYDIPASVEVILAEPESTKIPGFRLVRLTLRKDAFEKTEDLYISEDGRHYLMGAFKDLSVHPDNERLGRIDISRSAVRGDPKAPVLIVEYTDFECFFCKRGYEIMKERVMKEYAGKVRWVYKALPLSRIHPWAEPAAIAVECALDQSPEKFWKLHDLFFENQKEIRISNFEEKLEELVPKADLDAGKLGACVDAKKTLPRVARDMAEADAMGISGTPAFLVNGHKVSGADEGSLRRLIEESLQGRHGKL